MIRDIQKLNLPQRFYIKITKDIAYLLSYEGIQIEKIILFGSCARGKCKVTSDLDLCLITKESVDRYTRGDIASFLEEALEGVKTDIVFYNQEIYQNADSLIAKQIKTDGVLIYSKD